MIVGRFTKDELNATSSAHGKSKKRQKKNRLVTVRQLIRPSDGTTATTTIIDIRRQKCPIDLNRNDAILGLAVQLAEQLDTVNPTSE